MLCAINMSLINPPEGLVYDEVLLAACVVHTAAIIGKRLSPTLLQVRQKGRRYDVVGNHCAFVVAHILQHIVVAAEVQDHAG